MLRSDHSILSNEGATLSELWREEGNTCLAEGEEIVVQLEIDLDAALHFRQGIVMLTNRRLLAKQGDAQWQSVELRAGLSLTHRDHAGVGMLVLCDASGLLGQWHYTLNHDGAVRRLVERFREHVAALAGSRAVAAPPSVVCPICETVILDGAEKCPDCAGSKQEAPSVRTLFRLGRFARPYQKSLVLGLVLTLLATGAALVPPYLVMPLTDDVLIPFQNGVPIDPMRVALLLGGLLVAAVLAWMLDWAKTYILAIVSENIGSDLRNTTFAHLQGLSLEYFSGKRTGDLMARISSGTDRLCIFLSSHLLDFITDLLMIVMTAIILISINPWLALVTLLPLPFIVWLIQIVRNRMRNGFEQVYRIWSEVTNVLADAIPGIRVIKAFAQEQREIERFRTANTHNLEVNIRVNKVWALFTPTVTVLTEIGLLVVWAFGIWLVAGKAITVGVLLTFIAYTGRFYSRLGSMSRIVSVTEKAAACAKRIFDILDHVSSVPEPVNPVHLAKVDGGISLRDVTFRYGTRTILHGISLTIEPGQMVGLVGQSGSGKSTLTNLICRFYDVESGSISIDGVDIRTLPVAEYRRNIGLVLQEPFLFFGTISENIAYGKPEATREEIVAAARAAHAHEFILRLAQGYDSLVGERGQTLSGGERQRISIARALLINPRILILDEATSSVDTETELEIQAALDNLIRGRTTIAIAHRLSTLRRADRLVVFERGQIVEEGRHEELMANKGAYFRLDQAQTEYFNYLAEPVAAKESLEKLQTAKEA
jgi:ATP-binding cassette subfamily B protein